MRGDRVEVVVDVGDGTRTYEVEATRAGRRVDVRTGRGLVEVVEVTRGGTPVRTDVLDELRSRFRPEFLNRVDDIVVFAPLGMEQIENIVELQFQELRARLRERQITLEVTPAARHLIAERGYDPAYGARPLRRYISHDIETRLGRALLSGDVTDGSRLIIDVVDGDLKVEVDHQQEAAPVAA